MAFVVIIAGGTLFIQFSRESACNITTRHDLLLFADFQKFHHNMHGTCLGEQGQSLRNDGLKSSLLVENYSLSKGVSITVITGDPCAPYDQANPYILQAKHTRSNTVFEYNFATDRIIER
ncbi:MAG: hypothetical protein MI742_11115 [Desulfobacterales bacterium]|nr:hypothetical protein [Desulfobacterales bacterium]